MKTCIPIISLALLITACNKVETKPVTQLTDTIIKQEIPIANIANAFDSTGIIHNLLMDSAATFIQKEKSRDPYKLLSYLHSQYPSFCPDNTGTYFGTIEPKMLAGMYDDGQAFVRSLPFTAIEKKYMELLFNTIRSNEDSSFEGYRKKILAIEEQMMNEDRLSKSSRQMLLSATSVARYSGYYWLNSGRFTNRTIAARGFFKWLAAAANSIIADVSAAAVCYYVNVPYTYYPVICAVVSELAYITIMGWY